MTEKDKMAMEGLSQTMGTLDRPVAYFLLPLGGRDSYRQLLWLSYWSGRQLS